ncbi:MAG: hypothetical protein RQ745_11800 [Longimicrobiales bacterium]|nr:hypothetical protein [Longimicrobiales bacterium]
MDRARDELFSHINRCGVLQASPEDQKTWMTETIDYLAERYPDLSDLHLDQLHNIGLRFCAPAIGHGGDNAINADTDEMVESTESHDEEEVGVTADATAA